MQHAFTFVALFVFAILTACGASTTLPSATSTSKEITVAQLKTMLDQNENFLLLDVRTPAEFVQDGRVAQSTLIPLQELDCLYLPLGESQCYGV